MKREGFFSFINVDFIKNIYNSIIGVRNKLRYDQYFTFDNDNDLVTKAYVDGVATDPKQSPTIVPTAGSSLVNIPETIGKFVEFVVANGVVYKIGDGVTFNINTGIFDFSGAGVVFYGGDKVWAEYSEGLTETYYGVIILQNYSDITSHPTWGGTQERTYYILTDNENMGGKKGAYKYVPGFTTTPSQIAINFND